MVPLSFLCVSTTNSGGSCYFHVRLPLLAQFFEVSVRSAYLLNRTGFLVHVPHIYSHFVASQCHFYHIHSGNVHDLIDMLSDGCSSFLESMYSWMSLLKVSKLNVTSSIHPESVSMLTP